MQRGRRAWQPDPNAPPERYRFTDKVPVCGKKGGHDIPDEVSYSMKYHPRVHSAMVVMAFIKELEAIPNLYNYLVATIPCKTDPELARDLIDAMLDSGCIEKIDEPK